MARPHRRDLPGRPSRYSLAEAVEILQRMADGEPLYRICQDDHLPDAHTVRDWAADPRREWFSKAFQKAREDQAHRWFEETVAIADALDDKPSAPEVFAAQTKIRARQFAAGKIVSEYSDKTVVLPVGGRTEVNIFLPAKNSSTLEPRTIEHEPRLIGDDREDDTSE